MSNRIFRNIQRGSGTSSEVLAFRQRFRWHIISGTRPDRSGNDSHVPWTVATLRTALQSVMSGPDGKCSMPTERAVREWINAPVVPRQLYIRPVLDVLFGRVEALADQRQELHDLWQVARQVSQGLRGDRKDDLDDITPPVSTELWEIADPENISLGLAALYLHPPPSRPNQPTNSFPLHVTLSLSQLPDEIEGFAVRLGLKAASLVPFMKHCQLMELNEVDNIREGGGSFAVLGPRDDMTHTLAGRPLENTAIATVQYTTGAPPKIKMELQSRRRDLEVTPEDGSCDISAAREKILQVFLQECLVSDADRRVTWGRTTLKRKAGL